MPSPKRSALTVLVRQDGPAPRVLWARRRHHMRFLGGYHSFPGGAAEPGDQAPQAWSAPPGDQAEEDLYGCAARELFEELGLLVLADPGARSSLEAGALPGMTGSLDRWRRALLAGEADFFDEVIRSGARLDRARLRPMGRWITPAWSELRFETELFVVALREDELARIGADALPAQLQPDELTAGAWVTPTQALEAHRSGRALVTPPALSILRAIKTQHERGAPLRELGRVDQAGAGALALHEAPGRTYHVPLRSPTIPPATHTNCFVIGHERFVIVDPGSEDPGEVTRLFEVVDALRARGGQLAAILLTHHHPDHVCGIPALRERYGPLPIWAHRANDDLLGGWADGVDRALEDGQVLVIDDDHALECVFTPGHAPGHLAFLHQESGALLGGDLVASKGTILVRPPRGDMGSYLESLRRVRAMERVRLIQPAHGWTIPQPAQILDEYIDHRLEREAQVAAALAGADAWVEPMALVPMVYQDVPEQVWPLAAMSLAAHLEYLVEQGRAQKEGATYRAP